MSDGGGDLAVDGEGAEERSGRVDARFFRVRVFRGGRRGVLSEAFLRTV